MSSVDCHICADHQAIGFLALEFLRDRGCQNVAFLTMNPDWHLMQTRNLAFTAAAQESHIAASSYILSGNSAQADLFGPALFVFQN